MSESGDDAAAGDERSGAAAQSGREIWIEKYRPDSLEDVVGHPDVVERLQSYIEQDDLPNLLFSGPAGTGKCVTAETPVLTGRGVERIGRVVGDIEGFAEPDDDLSVLSFGNDGTFEYVEPSHVFAKETDDLRRVETRDGETVTVTPEHRLLVVTESGLEWRTADDLAEGDRIARPLTAPAPESDPGLDWTNAVEGDRIFVTVPESFARRHEIPPEANQVGTKRRVAGALREGRPVDEIVDDFDTTRATVEAYRRDLDAVDRDGHATTYPLSTLRSLDVSGDLREHVETIQYVTATNRRSPPITPPSTVTPELATFVGLAIAEARVDNGRVKFYNTDPGLLDRFARMGRELFDLRPDRGEQQGVPYVRFQSKTLTHFLSSCFDVFGDGDGIGSTLVSAPSEARRAFLRAMFDAEAHVTQTDTSGAVELTQRDPRVVTLLSYLLAGFGIPSRRTTERKAATNGTGTEREYHTLRISGAAHLARFREVVGFSVDKKADRLADHAAREANPNHDTMPAQSAVDDLCADLHLTKTDLIESSTDSDTRDRAAHLADLDRVVDAAVDRIETAQSVQRAVASLRRSVERLTAVPANWTEQREALEPLETRKEVAAATGVRPDYLLEYADGRRTPTARRTARLLAELDAVERPPDVEIVQQRLGEAIESLGIPYERVADGTDLRGTEVINLLETDDHDLASLPRFGTVADRVETLAAEMLTQSVLERLSALDRLSAGELYFDEVTAVTTVEESRRVYDLTVPGRRNYVAGRVPTVMHNTTSAVAIARTVYGDDWQDNFLELNASDDRGIDVVRGRIKDFARASFGSYDYRIVFLDEADSLTDDAQSALRRTMEQFSNNTRFILSCNYSSRIIDPIQSRCAVFRFSPLPDDAVAEYVREIAETEGIEVTDDAVEALTYVADGDMRRAINALQAAAVTGDVVDEAAVFAITATARPEEVEAMVTEALSGEFVAARGTLDELLTDRGIAGGDVVDQIHRSVWDYDLSDEAAVRVLDRLGEADYRIAEGANERIQLESLLAAVARESQGERE